MVLEKIFLGKEYLIELGIARWMGGWGMFMHALREAYRIGMEEDVGG
jgi:hypothetical protein